jgi:hypothetical protein
MEEIKRPSLNPLGRPKGSVRKPRVTDHMTPEQARDLLMMTIAEASEDTPLAWDKRKWIQDQYYGKAAQAVFTEDENGERVPMMIVVPPAVAHAYTLNANAHTETRRDDTQQGEI